MSKSLGNVVDPNDLINEYGSEAVRYYLARHISTFEDGDLTPLQFKDVYNANLANGLGNLISRIMKMSYDNSVVTLLYDQQYPPHIADAINKYNLNDAMNSIWSKIQRLDQKIAEEEPFKIVKSDPIMGKAIIQGLVSELYNIAICLQPFMPDTSKQIIELVQENKIPKKPLFLRKD